MTTRRYTFPDVREVLAARGDARPPVRPPTQRELVAASLIVRPERILNER
jgi:hypothetical protein